MKTGTPITLTDGRKGRVVAADVSGPWPILALIEDGRGGEYGMPFDATGGQGSTAVQIANIQDVK